MLSSLELINDVVLERKFFVQKMLKNCTGLYLHTNIIWDSPLPSMNVPMLWVKQ